MRIFISWRHGDAPGPTLQLFYAIQAKLKPDKLFWDQEEGSIRAGYNWRREIEENVSSCDAVLAVIGPRWLELLDEREQSGAPDFLKFELEIALRREIPVIPVYVDETPFLSPEQLPESIADLANNQGVPLREASGYGDLGNIVLRTEVAVVSGRDDPPRTPPAQPEAEPEPEPVRESDPEPEAETKTSPKPEPPAPAAPALAADGLGGAATAGDDGREDECLRLGEAALNEAEASGDVREIVRAGTAHAAWLIEFSRLSAALDLASAIAERAEVGLDEDDPDAVRAEAVRLVAETDLAGFVARSAPDAAAITQRCRLVLGASDPTTLLVSVVAAVGQIGTRGLDSALPDGEFAMSDTRIALGRGSAATLRLAHRWSRGVYASGDDSEVAALLPAAVRQLRQPLADAVDELGSDHHLVVKGSGLITLFEAFTEESPDDPDGVVTAAADRLGLSHPSALVLLTTNRFRLTHLNRHAPALEAARRVWIVHERRLGAMDPVTINWASLLATNATRAGDYAEAVRADETVLAGREKLLGPGHQLTAQASSDLAFDLMALPEPKKERAAEVAAERWRHAPADDGSPLPWGWTLVAVRVAGDLLDANRSEEAKRVAERAADSAMELWGPEFINTSLARQRLARACFYLDEDETAEAIAAEEWERVVRLNRINEDAVWTAYILLWLLCARNDLDAAVELADKAGELAGRDLPKGHAATIRLLAQGCRARFRAGDITLGNAMETWEHIEANQHGLDSDFSFIASLLLTSGDLGDASKKLEASTWGSAGIEADDIPILQRVFATFAPSRPIASSSLALIWSRVGLLLDAGAKDQEAEEIAKRIAKDQGAWDDETTLDAAPCATALLERQSMMTEALAVSERWVALLDAGGHQVDEREEKMLRAKTGLGRMLRYHGELDRAVALLTEVFTARVGGSPWEMDWNIDGILTTDEPRYMGKLIAHALLDRDGEGDDQRAAQLLSRLAYRCDRAWENIGSWIRMGPFDPFSFRRDGQLVRYDLLVEEAWRATRGIDRDRMPDRGAKPRSLPSPYGGFADELLERWRSVNRAG